MTIRVLMLTERFPPDIGGVSQSAERIARNLHGLTASMQEVEVEVVAWTKQLPPGELKSQTDSQKPNLQVHRLGQFGSWDLTMQHSLNVLEWLHGERPFDITWGHYLFPAGFLAVTFAGMMSIASTVSARGNDVDRMMFPPGDFARLRWTLEQATTVSAVSQDLASKIDVIVGTNRDCHVLQNAVDLDVFRACPGSERDSIRRRYGFGPHETVLGFCGELRHKKGLPFLLSALNEVQQQQPTKLLIVGNVRQQEQDRLNEFLQDHPELSERIVITGHDSDRRAIRDAINACDVMLQPSVWDGLPNAILEAMACECPVIASDAGGIPDVIQHGKSGVLVPRSQLHRLGEACLEFLSLAPERQQQIAQTGRIAMQQKFTAARESVRLRELIANTIDPS